MNTFTKNNQGDILVVDDHLENLLLLSEILSKHNYKVRKVTSGKQALNAIKVKPPELVLLDILMPEMNGYEVCKAIKDESKTALIPIIFLSALDNTLDKVKAFEIGGVDYITKPFQSEEVVARVRNQITILHQRKSLQQQQDLLQQKNKKLIQEIAYRQQIERDLEQAKLIAEEANKSKSYFLSNMSHEIRTPMNGIIGVTQLLKLTKQTPEQQNYTNLLQESANILLNVINDILDFSKLESKKVSLENHVINLEDTLKFVYDLLHQSALDKQIELEYEFPKNVPLQVITDEYRLRQILLNLISNAIKFTDHGKVNVSVCYQEMSNQSPRYLYFAIADTGIGIQKNHLHRLFNVFTQADDSISRKYGGTGLGLAICKSLTELMGGTIWVQSVGGVGGKPMENWQPNPQLKVGSVFHFAIAIDIPNPIPKRQKHQDAITVDADMAKNIPLKILLVEDNLMNQKLIDIILQKFGYVIDIANNGLEAIDALRSQVYDVVLMDVQMPEMDGITATKWIRQHLEYQPYIIAITANSSGIDLQNCFEAGMNNYIRKPVKIQELMHIMLQLRH